MALPDRAIHLDAQEEIAMCASGYLDTAEGQVGVKSRKRRASAGTVSVLLAAATAVLLALASAWFVTGAGSDYPEPVVAAE